MPPATILADAAAEFRRYKALAEDALAQASEAELLRTLDAESNSMAMIMKHIAGNLRSRWTDFLTTDGEKPDRRRDTEFVAEAPDTPQTLLQRWEEGWSRLFETLAALRPEDLDRIIVIRGEPHSALRALQRSLAHTAYHVGQIVFLAKHFAGERWKTLSIPRGKSEEFLAATRRQWEEKLRGSK